MLLTDAKTPISKKSSSRACLFKEARPLSRCLYCSGVGAGIKLEWDMTPRLINKLFPLPESPRSPASSATAPPPCGVPSGRPSWVRVAMKEGRRDVPGDGTRGEFDPVSFRAT